MTSKSPVSAALQQQKVSSTPETAPAAIPTSPQPVSFPSPQTFDFIPPLHALLLRLLSSTTSSSAAAAAAATQSTNTEGGSQSQQQQHQQQQSQQKQSQQPPSQQKSTTSSSTAPSTQTVPLPPATGDSSFVSNANTLPPLEAKDLSTATSAIRIRIQKARGVVENLPDVDRTIDEQSEEIDELQERIACLKAVIADFGRRAAVKEDDKMDESV